MAVVELFVLPAGSILGDLTLDQHQRRRVGVDLEARGGPDAEGARGNEFKGKRQFGGFGVFDRGELVGGDGVEDAEHIVEGLAREQLVATVADRAAACGGVKFGEAIGTVIGIGEAPEIFADVHDLVEQTLVLVRRIYRNLSLRGDGEYQTEQKRP